MRVDAVILAASVLRHKYSDLRAIEFERDLIAFADTVRAEALEEAVRVAEGYGKQAHDMGDGERWSVAMDICWRNRWISWSLCFVLGALCGLRW